MATTYKVLGQSAPSATTATTLYTVPGGTQVVGSSVVICNQGAAGSYRIAVRVAGATLTQAQYLCYDTPISANGTVAYTIGFTLGAGDVITVYASHANFSFNAFGGEVA